MMVGAIVTATEMQNNFGKYMNLVVKGQEIVVTKNGKTVGRFVPQDTVISYLSDSLRGIIKEDLDYEEEKGKALEEKYGITD